MNAPYTGWEVAVYNGSFPLDFLAADERVLSAGDGTGAVIIRGALHDDVRLNVDDAIVRDPTGRLHRAVVHNESPTVEYEVGRL